MSLNAFTPISAPGPPALDLLLKTLLSSSEFNDMQEKNWNSISRMIPGTTPRQCQRRYEELLKEDLMAQNDFPKPQLTTSGVSIKSTRAEVDGTEQRPSRPGSAAKTRSNKGDKDSGSVKSLNTRPLSADQGPGGYARMRSNPVMVIHVCDEAKNLKQDFHCPRDLLVAEMKYFAEYLSTDAQRWEEVDISVHCDVQIFDWLMKFVKRGSKEVEEAPKLEPTNVISILISSDFLKMDNLVQVCIEFCHRNMSAIVATPCNMNCINDKLVTRIADLFTHNEADDVKDRKDKFKRVSQIKHTPPPKWCILAVVSRSKLFQKKIEKLFDSSIQNTCSPENASSLFRCSVCKKLLTNSLQGKVNCLQTRLNIDSKGNLFYNHIKDATWDLNEYVLELKNTLKHWRDVYWRLWGIINYLNCSRCGEIFPCAELGHCRYHLESAKFDNFGSNTALGVYPCCEQKALRFDPTQNNKGCKVRDHIVSIYQQSSDNNSNNASGNTNSSNPPSSDPKPSEKEKVYNDLLSHRDAVCVAYQQLVSHTDGDDKVDVFAMAEQALGIRTSLLSTSTSDATLSEDGRSESKPRLQALTMEREVSCEEEFGLSEDDEMGDDEDYKAKRTKPRRSRVTVDPQAILLDAPSFGTTRTRKWDSSRSLRWNQDSQREDDQRRMNEMVSYLTKLRLSADKLEKLKQKEYAGGWFSRLEAQWKAVNMPPPKAPNTFQSFRNKPRIGAIPK